MRNLLALLPLVAACVDSGPAPLATCPARSVAVADPMMLRGSVLDAFGGAPIVTTVEFHDLAHDTLLAQTVTDDDGRYELPMSTAGVPPTLYRRATAFDYLDAYAYDPPGVDDPRILPLISAGDADRVAASMGLQRDAATGMLLVIVTDCEGRGVEGATVDVAGEAHVIYLGADTRYDPERTETSSNSAALVLGVPPGPVDLIVEHAGAELGTRWPVVSHANALTTTVRTP